MKYLPALPALALAAFLLAACSTTSPTPATQPTTQPAEKPDPLREKLTAFIQHPVVFQQTCFASDQFPSCEFDNPDEVRALIGPYTLKPTFYNAQGDPVTTATAPGRYAAVVTIQYEARTTHRFITLCKLPSASTQPSDPKTSPPPGVDPEIFKARVSEIPARRGGKYNLNRPWITADAIVAASLYDLTALKHAGQLLPHDSLLDLDRQWWLTFKRKFYGYDKAYPRPFTSPGPLPGKPSVTLHDGSPKDAGMTPDAIERIDKECQAWLKESGTGFSLCVVRHGVVVFHKAYGNRDLRRAKTEIPYTNDTVGPLDSTTKFLSGCLIAQFAEQGLINFEDPIDKYLPALRPPLSPLHMQNPPTIRSLYTHNAGFIDGSHWGDMMNDLEENIADIAPLLHKDSTHKYQGTGHAIGSKIMESITGESLPRLFEKHLFAPLGCTNMKTDYSSFGAVASSIELARIGQMMLNGGSYGNLRFTSPKIIQAMQPIPGHDRFDPDKSIRWGIGIKMFDSDNFSPQAYGGSGACGSFLKLDPKYDLVVTMVRDAEGDKYLPHRGALIKTIISCIK